MAGKSIERRMSALKKKVAGETAYRDPAMTWVHEASGNVIYAHLLSLHVPTDSVPYYRVKLLDSCMVVPSRPGRSKKSHVMPAMVGMIVSLAETADISCLRYFIDEMRMNGHGYDVWIRWMPFRQQVHVKKTDEIEKIEEGGSLGKKEDLDDRVL